LTDGADPKFDPSGTKIAYVLKGKIWTIDVTGKQKKRIGRFMNEARPSWSPDGKRIVFASYGSGGRKFQLHIMDSNGTNARTLIEPPTGAYDQDVLPRYSPDGKYIVWTRASQLWIMDTSGRNSHPLTNKAAKRSEYIGDFSPDGKFVAYLRSDNAIEPLLPHTKIWLIRSNSEDQRIFLDTISANHVKWSSDGKFFYYNTWNVIWKIDVEGKKPKERIFECPDEAVRWDISKDEQWIAYDNAYNDYDEVGKIYLAPLRKNR